MHRDTYDESDVSESQLEEETSERENSECAETEEEESEDDGETGEEDSDSEDDESDMGPDLARGIGNIETSSEDEGDLDDLFPKEPEIEHSWGELDKDAPRGEEVKLHLHMEICYVITSKVYIVTS